MRVHPLIVVLGASLVFIIPKEELFNPLLRDLAKQKITRKRHTLTCMAYSTQKANVTTLFIFGDLMVISR